jgi:hypothetical protein
VRARKANEIQKLKLVCDNYYKDPPIEVDDILNGRLHMIYIIDIDEGKIQEMDVETYLDELQIASELSNRIMKKF